MYVLFRYNSIVCEMTDLRVYLDLIVGFDCFAQRLHSFFTFKCYNNHMSKLFIIIIA